MNVGDIGRYMRATLQMCKYILTERGYEGGADMVDWVSRKDKINRLPEKMFDKVSTIFLLSQLSVGGDLEAALEIRKTTKNKEKKKADVVEKVRASSEGTGPEVLIGKTFYDFKKLLNVPNVFIRRVKPLTFDKDGQLLVVVHSGSNVESFRNALTRATDCLGGSCRIVVILWGKKTHPGAGTSSLGFLSLAVTRFQKTFPNVFVEMWHESELQYDVTTHHLVPTHTPITREEHKRNLPKINPDHHRKLLTSDVQARIHGLQEGDIVRVKRVDAKLAGESDSYLVTKNDK